MMMIMTRETSLRRMKTTAIGLDRTSDGTRLRVESILLRDPHDAELPR